MRIQLITKLKTTNIGNQALSDELIKLCSNLKSESQYSVLGRPTGLYGYSIEKLAKSDNPLKLFEKWVDQLLIHLKKSDDFEINHEYVTLTDFKNIKVKHDSLFQKIKQVFRKYIHSDKFFARTYQKRFNKVCACDAFIYSGAGEVGDNNIFLRQLLEIRILQKLNKKTFAINQSMEATETPVKQICSLVYRNMEKIVVRGQHSKDLLISLGCSKDKIICAPDSAFLNKNPDSSLIKEMKEKFEIMENSVGINVTSHIFKHFNEWGSVIDYLKKAGYKVYFITNDPFGDFKVKEFFEKQYGVNGITEFLNYHDYSALLANFKFIISCRLHSNELALTAQTPVIPIEGSKFKTTEVFELIKYPIKPIMAYNNIAFEREIISLIKLMDTEQDNFKLFIKNNINHIRNSSHLNKIV